MSGTGCRKIKTDVLVIGAGLAGIIAALTAAEKGVDVCLVSRSKICSGSSFYPGTWGLGLIGPNGEEDEEDLEETILAVGEGMAEPELVHRLVTGIEDGISYLRRLGVVLKEAENKEQKEFIPCFDHKKRGWHGLEKESASKVFNTELKKKGVHLLEKTAVIELLKDGETVCGAIGVREEENHLCTMRFTAGAVIIATGGLGGLFSRHLNTEDVRATGQYLALEAGAELINIEFMQMMPGYISPAYQTIYNEKMFCCSRFETDDGVLFADWNQQELQSCMDIRSTHGPFTSRLHSGEIDKELFRQFRNHPQGIRTTYHSLEQELPEFVNTYFTWLEKEKGLTREDPVWLGIFAHASNGGIRIDEEGRTRIPSLYACGEVTGGMHGADRIGGLSTANALVFGRIAGKSAAENAMGAKTEADKQKEEYFEQCSCAKELLGKIQHLNFETAMVLRSQINSEYALKELEKYREKMQKDLQCEKSGELLTKEIVQTADLKAALMLSTVLHQAILQRKESRGPHFRTDYPEKQQQYEKPSVIRWQKRGKNEKFR